MTTERFIPPAAEDLPEGALDSAAEGANRLDAWALDPRGRNFLAHALVQLARDGWLRTAPAAVPVPPPADQTALRELIAAAARTVRLRLGPNAVAMAQRGEPIILNLNESDDLADAVLAVLPEQADRAAVLRWAADELGRMDYDTDNTDYGYDTYRDAWNGGVMDAAALLRRVAAEEQPAETQDADRAALRDQIAEALMRWAERNNSSQYASMRRPETVRQNAYGRADAVLAVLFASTTCGAREPEPRTGTSPCVLPAGHGGAKHQDKWTNQWPAAGEAPRG